MKVQSFFSGPKAKVLASIAGLLVSGSLIASYLKDSPDTAWYYVISFYWAWILASVWMIIPFHEVKQMFRRPQKGFWYLLPAIFIIPAFITVFLPHADLLQLDRLLLLNILAAIINPFIEEIYWRGMISKIFERQAWMSFSVSVTGFALSHPLLMGINSESLDGMPGFFGSLVTGTIWWLCYNKTKSLTGNVVTHSIANICGMTVYVLSNRIIM
ncbi:MAG TPA: CPBP family intramembrane glutamic endopeptidase [Sphingobacteriaceae bacterium]